MCNTPSHSCRSASKVYLSTSYYVQKVRITHGESLPFLIYQQMFSLSKGTEYLPSTLPSRTGTVFWSVTRDTSTRQIFIKVAQSLFRAPVG